MIRPRTAVALPVWAFVAAVGLLLVLLVRAQPIQSSLHFTNQPARVTAPGAGAATQPAASQPVNVIRKTGTTQPVSAPSQQGAAQQPNTSQSGINSNNNPCLRAGKPAPMCPVAAP